MKLQSQLVVLSACKTSGVNHFRFDSNLGFVTEFLHAGSKSVIASLWPVPDRQTATFMDNFYHLLAHGAAPADALIAAKRMSIDTAPVRDWSAFQLMTR